MAFAIIYYARKKPMQDFEDVLSKRKYMPKCLLKDSTL